ncbi:hypothetical protein CANCADRAFT_32062 [Tortispora caseinolytica NRRL Y-17796]|uniref:Lysophospholipase NTE1 n=1 Tax=Tortispora caseinolytica NRRL Y-17796 TaxID=767744 RepID=A0A1E4TIB0_9ASCO|nr:hypothetical protein CANCADRAFT_32062 [Tortispora caseinolytica NRRL Y-17796]
MIRLLHMITVTLPGYILLLLGRSYSITLPFSTLLLIIAAAVIIVLAIVRYRYLTSYAKLKEEPRHEVPHVDFIQDDRRDQKQGFNTYVDDFMGAIKIFGYLDRQVFHELTRNMQTFKLAEGDIISLNEESGFCIAVDGLAEVFVHSAESDSLPDQSTNGLRQILVNGKHKYRILTEVGPGSPLTSLTLNLSLFLKAAKGSESRSESRTSSSDLTRRLNSVGGIMSVPQFPEPYDSLLSTSSIHSPGERTPSENAEPETVPTVIACAKVDTTIAVIPAFAFRRVMSLHPKAASHMFHAILDRFVRVTFQTGHRYLGLTREIMQTEVNLNQSMEYLLPTYLRDGAIERLKDRFYNAEQNDSVTSSNTADGLGTVISPVKRRSRKDMKFSAPNENGKVTRRVQIDPNENHPGDLLSSVPLSRRDTSLSIQGLADKASSCSVKVNFPDASEDDNEDTVIRSAIVDILMTQIGLDSDIVQTNRHQSESYSSLSRNGKHGLDYNHDLSPSVRSTPGFGPVPALSALDANSVDDESSSHFSVTQDRVAAARAELERNVHLIHYKKDSKIISHNDPSLGLLFLIDGFLEMKCPNTFSSEMETIYEVKPGGIAGYVSTICSSTSLVDIHAKTDAYVGYIPKSVIEKIFDRYPTLVFGVISKLKDNLPKLILHLDFSLEWVPLDAGQVLYRKNDSADSLYIVLNGRVRCVDHDNGKTHVIRECGQGDSIGELEVLTITKRPFTVHAIRKTEVVRIPRILFETLAAEHPAITFQTSRIIAARLSEVSNKAGLRNFGAGATEVLQPTNMRTIGIIPASKDIPLEMFGQSLLSAFHQIGKKAVMLNQATVLNHLGRLAFSTLGQLKLSGYLSDMEEKYDLVLYLADGKASTTWTEVCVSQSDCILLVALDQGDAVVGEYEQFMLGSKSTARKELVLIHPERYVPPGMTDKWLRNRPWIERHYHVQIPYKTNMIQRNELTGKLASIRSKMQDWQSELQKYAFRRENRKAMPVYSSSHTYKNDFARMARILSGDAVGLVLGGGGARGIAHVGMIRAIEELGIPVDIVGGTSIGSFVGGLYARDSDLVPIYGRVKQFSGRIGSIWRNILDLTYPATAYLTGHEFNRGIWKIFGNGRIEDFWLQYYNNTTNITHSRMEIHSYGYAWRYIRASMSLAGLLPPVTDNGSMLLDGGYVDNLPVDHMRKLGANIILAIDVGSMDDTTPMSYGDTLSGLWVIFNRWNPFSTQPNPPNLAEIQARLAYVSSVGALEKVKQLPGCFYLRPPIDDFATLDFSKFDEVYRVGYQYGRRELHRLVAEGKLDGIPGFGSKKDARQKKMVRRNSL